MEKVMKKEVKAKIEGAMNHVLSDLQVVASRKIKKMIAAASEKIVDEIKRDLKKQHKKENKIARKKTKSASKALKSKAKKSKIVVN